MNIALIKIVACLNQLRTIVTQKTLGYFENLIIFSYFHILWAADWDHRNTCKDLASSFSLAKSSFPFEEFSASIASFLLKPSFTKLSIADSGWLEVIFRSSAESGKFILALAGNSDSDKNLVSTFADFIMRTFLSNRSRPRSMSMVDAADNFLNESLRRFGAGSPNQIHFADCWPLMTSRHSQFVHFLPILNFLYVETYVPSCLHKYIEFKFLKKTRTASINSRSSIDSSKLARFSEKNILSSRITPDESSNTKNTKEKNKTRAFNWKKIKKKFYSLIFDIQLLVFYNPSIKPPCPDKKAQVYLYLIQIPYQFSHIFKNTWLLRDN
ncbi:hypothetical protein BpHYR1_048983 [Brachionus plicatilis]|uniref:Uncharacterized protein n=1 Tax=Brachionus plicatilis TaxID=10195 RepID=A0A3M7PT80_BRAPC|nr:hypothetical protein BpHYR1_048983 [Brachionus plicatilis]